MINVEETKKLIEVIIDARLTLNKAMGKLDGHGHKHRSIADANTAMNAANNMLIGASIRLESVVHEHEHEIWRKENIRGGKA